MKRDGLLLAIVALLSSVWIVTASRQVGATFDEPFYLEGGLDYWRHGHFGMLLAAGTMPLPAHLQTLPIHISEWRSGQQLSVERDLGAMLQLARPVTIVFWVLLLVSVMRLGRLFGGEWAGRTAVLLVAIEPNFLAHAGLATTDIALAACFAAFCADFLGRRAQPAAWRIGLPALWFGLAITTKVSALALLPYAVVIAMMREEHDRTTRWRLAVDTAIIAMAGFVFAILYCGSGGQTWLAGTLSRMPADHWLRPLVAWVGALPVFPNALYAIWFQLAHNQSGQAVFLAGHADTRALWYYVPVLLTIKLTVSMLAMVLIACALPISRARTLIVAAAFLIATMIVFQVQTGIRFLLPLLAVLIGWLAARLAPLYAAAGQQVRLAMAALMVAIAIESMFVWPDALRYVNPFWGGAREGYRVVSDSNYDWGQGLPALAEWHRANNAPLSVWYFGTDTRYPEITRINPRTSDFDVRSLDGRLLAVSASLLYGGYLESPGRGRDLIQRLRQSTPIARTSTFFIYDNVR